jgi:hypothetical protein
MELYGKKIFNWEKFPTIPVEKRKDAIVHALNTFIKGIETSKVQGLTGPDLAKISGADPNLVQVPPVILVMSDTIKFPDRGYEMLFDEVDMRASQADAFEMLDVTGGVTFYQKAPGEEAKLSNIPTTARSYVHLLRFIGGYNLLDDWIRFNKYYLIDDLAADTVRRWFDQKAVIFYGLLEALPSSIDQAFDTDDVTTINDACSSILVNLQNLGYPIDENSVFTITCNPKLRGRIFRALTSTFLLPNTNNNQVVYNIGTVISTTKIQNSYYYVSLPGGKNKRGEWEDLNLRPPQRNELMLGASYVWTGAYNGIIGEPGQHVRCALS